MSVRDYSRSTIYVQHVCAGRLIISLARLAAMTYLTKRTYYRIIIVAQMGGNCYSTLAIKRI